MQTSYIQLLEVVSSMFLEIQAFYYTNYSFMVFFFNPRITGTVVACTACYNSDTTAVYQFTLLFSENLEAKKT